MLMGIILLTLALPTGILLVVDLLREQHNSTT
ncbi:transcriptional regulator [Lysinibacillus contaminans]